MHTPKCFQSREWTDFLLICIVPQLSHFLKIGGADQFDLSLHCAIIYADACFFSPRTFFVLCHGEYTLLCTRHRIL